jgi:hypothetical protein
MATTTNYGWTTPDDTALVKDGAAAIRTLGSSVDTTTKALNPSTTLGDIEYRSSTANTNTRLGIGSTGNVLTVAGGVPSWAAPAGGAPAIAQIATGNITSGTSVTISSLSSYDTLILLINGVTWATGSDVLACQINATATSYTVVEAASKSSESSGEKRINTGAIRFNGPFGQLNTNTASTYYAVFNNCKATGFTNFLVSGKFNDSSNTNCFSNVSGIFTSAAAVSSLKIFTGEEYTFNGSGTYTIYGG